MMIKAIPTRYAGVQFRSRLEARWAAFFDLLGLKWDYEPIDLNGWCPDFSLTFPETIVFAEVKPVVIDRSSYKINPEFKKAVAHEQNVQVLLLGISPHERLDHGIGFLLNQPAGASYKQEHLLQRFCFFIHMEDMDDAWREAGNRVQWRPPVKAAS